MKSSVVLTLALLGTAQATVFDDVSEFFASIPVTKRDRMALMDPSLRTVHTEAEKKNIAAFSHKHTLRATSHREILGEKMGLPKRTPYYEVLR